MVQRVQLLDESDMSPAQAKTFARFPSNLAKALLLTKDSADPHFDLGASFTRGLVTFIDREVVVMRVASIVDSEFERFIHYPLALRAGLSEVEIADVENANYEALSPSRAALVRYVSECIINAKASEAAFLALMAHYDQHQIAEITHLAGHCWMTAMYLSSLDIPLDDGETPWSNLGTRAAED